MASNKNNLLLTYRYNNSTNPKNPKDGQKRVKNPKSDLVLLIYIIIDYSILT